MYVIDFTGRVVLVLGGGTGIGAAIARAFVDAGADLAASYYDTDIEVERTLDTIQRMARRCLIRRVDSRHVAEVEAMVDETVHVFGTIDVLVYNAGLTDPQPLFELNEEQWDRTLDINLKAMFFCVRRAAAYMRDQGRQGSIVLLSSVHSIQAMADHPHYDASKGGVNMLTRSLAAQLAPVGIRVNAVAPGATYVERHKAIGLYDPVELGKQIPLGRVGAPEDIADIAVYLASNRAAYVTGQVLLADGGLTLRLPLH